ncbi:MAG TPA: preprotein translocase subunit SecY [Lachnospiraceae bacterium]|nr:preprotein translocase subunit SecY [Lachnospiraceae bacterium]
MLQTLKNAFTVKEIRTKIINMLIVLVIVRLGTHIPVPGIDLAQLATNSDNSTLYALITGGSYGTIFAMGIGPYITSSIIMQLLTVAIPALEEMQKDGETGRKKISQITRCVTVALALLQGAGQVYTIHNFFTNPGWYVYIVALITMMSGTVFIMWLGEKLTEVGIGNGASFIIFANILSGFKSGVMSLYTYAAEGSAMAWIIVGVILVVLLVVMVFVILVQDGERRIPVQYSRKLVGNRYMGGNNSFIPIKVNIAGVMSIIFAISILQFPATINQLVNSTTLQKISDVLSTRHPVGAILYVVLIFVFTFFYTSFAFNPVEVAENMKKSGGFVPGIRPGKPTSDYIQKIVDRISLIGAFAYAIIAMVPVVLEWLTRINMGFGGTTLLIVAGVALEVIKQLETQLINRNYKGFLTA